MLDYAFLLMYLWAVSYTLTNMKIINQVKYYNNIFKHRNTFATSGLSMGLVPKELKTY